MIDFRSWIKTNYDFYFLEAQVEKDPEVYRAEIEKWYRQNVFPKSLEDFRNKSEEEKDKLLEKHLKQVIQDNKFPDNSKAILDSPEYIREMEKYINQARLPDRQKPTKKSLKKYIDQLKSSGQYPDIDSPEYTQGNLGQQELRKQYQKSITREARKLLLNDILMTQGREFMASARKAVHDRTKAILINKEATKKMLAEIDEEATASYNVAREKWKEQNPYDDSADIGKDRPSPYKFVSPSELEDIKGDNKRLLDIDPKLMAQMMQQFKKKAKAAAEALDTSKLTLAEKTAAEKKKYDEVLKQLMDEFKKEQQERIEILKSDDGLDPKKLYFACKAARKVKDKNAQIEIIKNRFPDIDLDTKRVERILQKCKILKAEKVSRKSTKTKLDLSSVSLQKDLNKGIIEKFGFPKTDENDLAVNPFNAIKGGIRNSNKFKNAKKAGRFINFDEILMDVIARMYGDNQILHNYDKPNAELPDEIKNLKRDEDGILSNEKDSDGKSAVKKALEAIFRNASRNTDDWFAEDEKISKDQRYGQDDQGNQVDYGKEAIVSAAKAGKYRRVGMRDVMIRMSNTISLYVKASIEALKEKNKVKAKENLKNAKDTLKNLIKNTKDGEIANKDKWQGIFDSLATLIDHDTMKAEFLPANYNPDVEIEKIEYATKQISGIQPRGLDPTTNKMWQRFVGYTSGEGNQPFGSFGSIEDVRGEKLSPEKIKNVFDAIEDRTIAKLPDGTDNKSKTTFDKIKKIAPALLKNVVIEPSRRLFSIDPKTIFPDNTKNIFDENEDISNKNVGEVLKDFLKSEEKKPEDQKSIKNARTLEKLKGPRGSTFFYLMQVVQQTNPDAIDKTTITPLTNLFKELGFAMGVPIDPSSIGKKGKKADLPLMATSYDQRQASIKKARQKEKEELDDEHSRIYYKIVDMQKEDDEREKKGQPRLHIVPNTKGQDDNLLMGYNNGLPEVGYHDDISSFGEPKKELATLRQQLKALTGRLHIFTSIYDKTKIDGPRPITSLTLRNFPAGSTETFGSKKQMLGALPREERDKYIALPPTLPNVRGEQVPKRKRIYSPYDIVKYHEPIGDPVALKKFNDELRKNPSFLDAIMKKAHENHLVNISGWKSLFEHFVFRTLYKTNEGEVFELAKNRK